MKNPNRRAAERRQQESGLALADTLIIYNSRLGSTEQYAVWLAEELGADLMPFEKKKFGYMSLYPYVIYGAWIRGTEITHFDLIRRNYANFSLDNREVFYYAVGLAEDTPEYRQAILDRNAFSGMNQERLFMLPGRFDRDRLSAVDKKVFKMSLNPADAIFQGQAESLRDRIEQGYDGVARENLEGLIAAVKGARGK